MAVVENRRADERTVAAREVEDVLAYLADDIAWLRSLDWMDPDKKLDWLERHVENARLALGLDGARRKAVS